MISRLHQATRSLRAVRSTSREWAGWFLVALLLLAQTHATAHHAFVAHHVCAVDGELAHGDHEHGAHRHGVHQHGVHEHGVHEAEAHGPAEHGHGATLDHGEATEGPSFHSSNAELAHGEHCSNPNSRDERRLIGFPPGLVTRSSTSVRTARALETQLFGRRLPVFRLAPKQSPPEFA